MIANPRKTRSLRRLGPVDLGSLRDDILAIPDSMWASENALKPNRGPSYDSLDRTEHIIFRFIRNYRDCRESMDFPLWATWRERLEPVLQAAIAPYGYTRVQFPRVMLARMAAGGKILVHRDANAAALWPHKIHIPITTNDKVRFYIEPHHYHLEVGQAYEVNNIDLHAVDNDGDTSRIHLIFECFDVDQPYV